MSHGEAGIAGERDLARVCRCSGWSGGFGWRERWRVASAVRGDGDERIPRSAPVECPAIVALASKGPHARQGLAPVGSRVLPRRCSIATMLMSGCLPAVGL